MADATEPEPTRDVTLKLQDGQIIKSDRALLSKYSPFFKQKLKNKTVNGETVELPNIQGPVFEIVESFLRTGTFPEQVISIVEYVKILEYCQMWGIEHLRKATMEEMRKTVVKWQSNSCPKSCLAIYEEDDDSAVVPSTQGNCEMKQTVFGEDINMGDDIGIGNSKAEETNEEKAAGDGCSINASVGERATDSADRNIAPDIHSTPMAKRRRVEPFLPNNVSGTLPVNTEESRSLNLDTTPIIDGELPKEKGGSIEEMPDDLNDLFFRVATCTQNEYPCYTSLIKRTFYGRNSLKDPIGSVNLVGFKLTKRNLQVIVQNPVETIVDGNCAFIEGENTEHEARTKSLLSFIRTLDIQDYLVFTTHATNVSVETLWALDRRIFFRLNGITFLEMDHATKRIVINYLRDAPKILQSCPQVKTLAISNCEFNMVDVENMSASVDEFVAYRIWGDFKIKTIFDSFPHLKEFRMWKFEPPITGFYPSVYYQRLNICFHDLILPYGNLRVLVLASVQVHFGDKNAVATRIEELRLECCVIRKEESQVTLCETFAKIFPKLKKLFLQGFTSADSRESSRDITCLHSLYGALQIDTLEWIRVLFLNWEYDNGCCGCHVEMTGFFAELELGEMTNFLLERNGGNAIKQSWRSWWRATCYDGGCERESYQDMMDTLEFEWCRLNLFYKDVSSFQQYFIDNEDNEQIMFPKTSSF